MHRITGATPGRAHAQGTLAETIHEGAEEEDSVCATVLHVQSPKRVESDRSSTVGSSRGCQKRSSSLAVRRRIREVQMFRWQHTTVGRRRGRGGGEGEEEGGEEGRWGEESPAADNHSAFAPTLALVVFTWQP